MTHDELDAAYRATTYVAHQDDATFEIRVDREHPELDEALRSSGASEWAYVTAWNPRSEATVSDVNDREQQQLEQQLQTRGVVFFRGTSRPDDSSCGEASVLAFICHEEAAQLGTRLEQNAIVVGRVGGRAKLLWLR